MAKEKKIIPRGKYILVKVEAPESKVNKFDIVIPDSEETEQKAQGVVQEVGTEIKDIKKGDQVVFGAYAGELMQVMENHVKVDYRLLYDDDVIAFLK